MDFLYGVIDKQIFELSNFSSIFVVGEYFLVFDTDSILYIYKDRLDSKPIHKTKWHKSLELIKPMETFLSFSEYMLNCDVYNGFINLEILLV